MISIEKGDIVFDVGVNIGNKAKSFLNSGAKVIGFEPQDKCYQFCKDRFSNNQNFLIENVALSDRIGTEVLYESNAHTISSMSKLFIDTVKKERFKEYEWNNEIIVTTSTLDEMINKYGTPKYIKIDVEGYELNVLKGLTKKVEYISIEFTPELLKSTVDCLDYLKEGLYNYVSRENPEFTFSEWKNKNEIIEFLSSIKDYQIEFGDVYIKSC